MWVSARGIADDIDAAAVVIDDVVVIVGAAVAEAVEVTVVDIRGGIGEFDRKFLGAIRGGGGGESGAAATPVRSYVIAQVQIVLSPPSDSGGWVGGRAWVGLMVVGTVVGGGGCGRRLAMVRIA